MKQTIPMIGQPRHYQWGGTSFIPNLVGQENHEQKPFAEWWLGAHPDSPSYINLDNDSRTLLEWLQCNPSAQSSAERQGEFPLPFLMKVLDVNQMLSIQIHPTKEQAKEGYIRQNNADIDRNSSIRTYRDRNDKPEMMVALTPCWLAHGFTSIDVIIKRLKPYISCEIFIDTLKKKGVEGAAHYVLYESETKIASIAKEVLTKNRQDYQTDTLSKNLPEYWLCRAILEHDSGEDRGLVMMLMMNIVNVPTGEAIYQGAGIPHAYLSGHNMEIMSNSDNVVRIGPTKLHVDLEEAWHLINCDIVTPELIKPRIVNSSGTIKQYFHKGSDAFALKQLQLTQELSKTFSHSSFLNIVMLVEGELTVITTTTKKTYIKGESFLVPAELEVNLESSHCVAYIASYGGKDEINGVQTRRLEQDNSIE